MFADSRLDSHFTGRAQRGWTTLTSFVLQSLGIAALLTLPLIYTEGLPKLHVLSVSAPLGPPPGRPPAAERRPTMNQGQSNMFHGIVVAPPTIPIGISHVVDDSHGQDAAPCAICVPGATGSMSNSNPILDSVGNTPAVVPSPPKPTAHPPRISHMMEGNLIYKVQPIYPPPARAARVQGAVVLRAIISRTGAIENLQVTSGHPMLVRAAIDAVRQWRYRPYILNDEPVEVETQVTVNFSLSGG
jgi:periplasmic protein TonB